MGLMGLMEGGEEREGAKGGRKAQRHRGAEAERQGGREWVDNVDGVDGGLQECGSVSNKKRRQVFYTAAT